MKFDIDAFRTGVSLPKFSGKLPRIPVASAISGLIVAAIVLATPNIWFERFVIATGLPDLVAAAAPPLGVKARIVFALIAALAVTSLTWVALTVALGRKARRPIDRFGYAPEEPVFDIPRRRRADSHPDAPPRRPISASDDLGMPLELTEVVTDEAEPVEAFAPAAEAEAPFELTGAYEYEASELPAAQEEHEALEWADEDEPRTEPEPEPETAAQEPVREEPIFTIPLRPRAEEAPAEEPAPATPEPAAVVPEPPVTPEAPEPVVSPAPSRPVSEEHRAELVDLVERLEAGLERRRARIAAQRQAESNVTAHPVARPASEKDLDGALRDALDALQRLTARGA